MKFELGINNCFAVKRWPQPDEWSAVIAEELGLSLVQHSLDLGGETSDGVAKIRQACGDAGIRIDSVFTGLSAYSGNLMLAPGELERDAGFELWAAGIEFAAALGAKSFGGHVGSLSRPDADNEPRREALWAELRGRLGRLSQLASRSGLESLLVENMACDREPYLMAQVRSLLDASATDDAPISLCLDVGHQCAPGIAGDEGDPYAWLRLMGGRTEIVHLQQTDASADHHWPFTSEFNAVGRIRPDLVLESLIESTADKMTLILEVIPSFEADDAEVLADLRESVNHWGQALGELAGAGAQAR